MVLNINGNLGHRAFEVLKPAIERRRPFRIVLYSIISLDFSVNHQVPRADVVVFTLQQFTLFAIPPHFPGVLHVSLQLLGSRILIWSSPSFE